MHCTYAIKIVCVQCYGDTMKYFTNLKADAVYDDNGSHNPLLEALPDLLSKKELFSQIMSIPELDDKTYLSGQKRAALMYQLAEMFIPLDYMYDMYNCIYRAIQSTYLTQNCYDSIRKMNYSIYDNITAVKKLQFCTQSESGAILGVPGIGKTSSLRHCLRTMPQIIAHQNYHGEMLYCQQITYLFVECPADCSIKTLGHNIGYAIDKALGTNYSTTLWRCTRETVGAVALTIKQLCATYHIGVIVLDEIQNVIAMNTVKRQNARLIKFLIELMNDTSTAIILVGTLESDLLFLREDHLKRRTRGLRLLPMEYDNVYKGFLQSIWEYQYTEKTVELNENMMKLIYTASSGITSYIVKIFTESQARAISIGAKAINERIIKETISALSIVKPKAYNTGLSISSFATRQERQEFNQGIDRIKEISVSKTIKRGRPAKMRDSKDILALLDSVKDLDTCEKILLQNNLLEVMI